MKKKREQSVDCVDELVAMAERRGVLRVELERVEARIDVLKGRLGGAGENGVSEPPSPSPRRPGLRAVPGARRGALLEQMLEAMGQKPSKKWRAADFAAMFGVPSTKVSNVVTCLYRKKRIVRVRRGVFRLAPDPASTQTTGSD